MTTLQKTSRANFVRQRRTTRTHPVQHSKKTGRDSSRTYNASSIFIPVEPRPVSRRALHQVHATTPGPNRRKTNHNDYIIDFTVGRSKVRAPALNLPTLGSRWISAGLTLLLGFLIYSMWTASPFMIKSAEVYGNLRLGTSEINTMLDIVGQPIFMAIPSQIMTNLQIAFPDLESVAVHVGFPNRIILDVKERNPILAWYLNGDLTWIDANGVAFTPRGEIPGLVQVVANGAPPAIPFDQALPLYGQKFISPELVQVMVALSAEIPTGMPMIFDPKYGIGWQDPRGWTVYVGQTVKDIRMKMEVYNSIVDNLSLQGVQPSLISVESLNAPFYK
jgi:hypothetical protein